MPSKTYKSVYYHIIFSTKGKKALLTDEIRENIYDYIWKSCKKLGYKLFRIGGTEDHIHLLIYIPPKTAVSTAVGNLKGSSSY